jgi:hypothetical protein
LTLKFGSHLSTDTRMNDLFTEEFIKTIDYLESLTIYSESGVIITNLPPNLKKFRYITENNNTLHVIPFTNLPVNLEHLEIVSKNLILRENCVLPTNLIYLKIITKCLCLSFLNFPDTLKVLILDVMIRDHNIYPVNLEVLSIKSDIYLTHIANLDKLRYLDLTENALDDNRNPIHIKYPKSLKHLRKNSKYKNARISKLVKNITWVITYYHNIGGVTGTTGPMGLTGTTGPMGLTGTTGPMGLPGTAGPMGATGFAGYH